MEWEEETKEKNLIFQCAYIKLCVLLLVKLGVKFEINYFVFSCSYSIHAYHLQNKIHEKYASYIISIENRALYSCSILRFRMKKFWQHFNAYLIILHLCTVNHMKICLCISWKNNKLKKCMCHSMFEKPSFSH